MSGPWNDVSEAFYEVELQWLEVLEGDELQPDSIHAFMAEVLEQSDFRSYNPATGKLEIVTPPAVLWDLPSDTPIVACYSVEDQALHFDPRLQGISAPDGAVEPMTFEARMAYGPGRLRKSLVLHELAHALDPYPRDRQGHGDDFVEIYADLVEIAFGQDEADELRKACDLDVPSRTTGFG